MADTDFQREYFEPVFLNIVLLNYKIKKRIPFSDDEKEFYNILRYAFPIIKRLADNGNLTLGESIEAKVENEPEKSNVQTEQHNYQHYSFNNVDYSSEEFDTDEIDPDEETKSSLFVIDRETVNVIEMTRNKNWIAIKCNDLNAHDMEDSDFESYTDSDSEDLYNEVTDDVDDGVEAINDPLIEDDVKGDDDTETAGEISNDDAEDTDESSVDTVLFNGKPIEFPEVPQVVHSL